MGDTGVSQGSGAPVAAAGGGGGTARGPPLAAGPGTVPMLDINRHNCNDTVRAWNDLSPEQRALKRKRGRYYHCLVSGITWNVDKDLYFLTLTSRKRDKNLGKDWHHLVTWIRQNYDEFEFCKLETTEGNGVLHVVFCGSRLDVKPLRQYWKNLRDSPQLRIEKISKKHSSKLKIYLLNQYLKNQNGFQRFSYSKGWLFPRYRSTWKNLVQGLGYHLALASWTTSLEAHEIPRSVPVPRQKHKSVTPAMRYERNIRRLKPEWCDEPVVSQE